MNCFTSSKRRAIAISGKMEVRYYDSEAYLFFKRSSFATDFASPMTAIPEFPRFLGERGTAHGQSSRSELTESNARWRVDPVFADMD